MQRRPTYPFEPRSNAYLEPGQFWAVPLSDGRFACGRVLAVPKDDPSLAISRKMFLAGLMNWVAHDRPTSETIAGSEVVAQGMAHVRTIQTTGGVVLGCRDLALDGIVGLREVTHRGGGTVYLYEGRSGCDRPCGPSPATFLSSARGATASSSGSRRRASP